MLCADGVGRFFASHVRRRSASSMEPSADGVAVQNRAKGVVYRLIAMQGMTGVVASTSTAQSAVSGYCIFAVPAVPWCIATERSGRSRHGRKEGHQAWPRWQPHSLAVSFLAPRSRSSPPFLPTAIECCGEDGIQLRLSQMRSHENGGTPRPRCWVAPAVADVREASTPSSDRRTWSVHFVPRRRYRQRYV